MCHVIVLVLDFRDSNIFDLAMGSAHLLPARPVRSTSTLDLLCVYARGKRRMYYSGGMNFCFETVAATLPTTFADIVDRHSVEHPYLWRDRESERRTHAVVIRNFVEVRENFHYSCRLCQNAELRGQYHVRDHLVDPVHQANVAKLADDHEKLLEIMKRSCRIMSEPNHTTIQKKADTIQSPLWKNTVHAEVHRYIFAREDPDHLLLDVPLRTLESYNALQCLVMLDLAVWKGQCLQQMPIVTDVFTAHRWFTSGWKIHKAEQRQSNSAMSTIVALVRPFLDIDIGQQRQS
jgi:hypothetical protein